MDNQRHKMQIEEEFSYIVLYLYIGVCIAIASEQQPKKPKTEIIAFRLKGSQRFPFPYNFISFW